MARHSRILLAAVLGIACAAEAPVARADLVTPDSIASPVLSSEIDDSVPSGGLVTNQYQGLGLLFSVQRLGEPAVIYSTAIIQLNNRDVFTGAYQATTSSGAVNHVSYQSPAGVTAALVQPGTTTQAVADSVTVSLYSNGPILAQLEAFDKNGRLLKTIATQVGGDLFAQLGFGELHFLQHFGEFLVLLLQFGADLFFLRVDVLLLDGVLRQLQDVLIEEDVFDEEIKDLFAGFVALGRRHTVEGAVHGRLGNGLAVDANGDARSGRRDGGDRRRGRRLGRGRKARQNQKRGRPPAALHPAHQQPPCSERRDGGERRPRAGGL